MKNTNLGFTKSKLIARLMLVVISVICVFNLSACERNDFFTSTQSGLKTTKSTSISSQNLPNTIETVQSEVELENGETITIAHGKDFNQDDIDFLLSFHKNTRNDMEICEPLMSYNLKNILSAGKQGHSILLAHFENPYFISAYLKSDASDYELNEWGDYKFDVTKYVWLKFYDLTQIVDEIDGMERTNDTYLLYDCTIKKDIVNGVEYNKNCKYYMEFKGEYNGAQIYDDYAHHPDELAATIAAVRTMPQCKRMVVAFQPHTYTRTKALFDDFVRELQKPDLVILAEIYAARERNTVGISSRDLAKEIPGSIYCATLQDVTKVLSELAQEGDLILTVGAGDIYKAGEALLKND